MLVVMPTAIPLAPLMSRLGSRAGRTVGSSSDPLRPGAGGDQGQSQSTTATGERRAEDEQPLPERILGLAVEGPWSEAGWTPYVLVVHEELVHAARWEGDG